MACNLIELASAIRTIQEDSNSLGKGFGCAGHILPYAISTSRFFPALGWRHPIDAVEDFFVDVFLLYLNSFDGGVGDHADFLVRRDALRVCVRSCTSRAARSASA